MAKQETVLRVFVSSPSDVTDEVSAVEAAVDELNASLPRELGRRLEVITWRTDVTPGIGADVQSVINEQIGENYDIFLGILWARFGTQTPRAGSGSEEEFERAYARHGALPGSIRVMIYFKKAPVDFDRIDPPQIEAIKAFRTRFGPKGVLFWDFSRREEFESYVRIHLARQVHEWGKTWGACLPSGGDNDALTVPKISEQFEEGILDLIERGTEGFQIATEAALRISTLQGHFTARIGEKTLQLDTLKSVPEGERSRLAKQVFNSAAVDMEQFAKGLSGEIAVLSEHFLIGVQAFSKSFTYTECYGAKDMNAAEPLGEVLSGLLATMEGSQNSMLGLSETIQRLPRFTTQFNRAKNSAAAAIEDYSRFSSTAVQLLLELGRNLDALKLFLAKQSPAETV